MAKIKIGDVFETKGSGSATVVEYINSQNVSVRFQNGHTNVVRTCHLRNGLVKNKYSPSVLGLGYLGEGLFTSRHTGGRITEEYSAWSNMLERCYKAGFHEKRPTYIGCSVCDDWLNFQVFAKWYTEQKGYGKGWHLDKDLTVFGNKVYSPSTCAVVPVGLNNLLIPRKSIRGKYPLGVCLQTNTPKYIAQTAKHTGGAYLGTFDTPEAAFNAYKEAKEYFVRDIANKYRNEIPQATYESLMSYSASITD